MNTKYYAHWSAPGPREFARSWFSKPENRDKPAATETDEYIAWEQLADVFTAR